MKRTQLVTLVAVLGLLMLPAIVFAAVQNVKVSGDITMRYLIRDDYDLQDDDDSDTFNSTTFAGGATRALGAGDTQEFGMQQVRLRVDAGLSDQISAYVEMLNQRDLDSPTGGAQGSPLFNVTNTGIGASSGVDGGGADTTNDQYSVIVNQAYLQAKEVFGYPVTFTVGRQNFHWDEGFVLSKDHLSNADPTNTITADEFTMSHALDGIKMGVDLDPWYLEGLFIQVQENSIISSDDEIVFGAYAHRSWTAYSAETSWFFLGRNDSSAADAFGETQVASDELFALGTHGSIRPWPKLKLTGDAVFQWGEEGGPPSTGNTLGGLSDFTPTGRVKQDIRAFAFDTRAEYLVDQVPWPTLAGSEWVFYSGEDYDEHGFSGAYRLLFRGKFHSAIREFQNFYYLTDVGGTGNITNQHTFLADVSFHPWNKPDWTFFARWLQYYYHHSPIPSRPKDIGQEVLFKLSYDYTEDLTLSILASFFFPGDYFERGDPVNGGTGRVDQRDSHSAASMLVGEVSLRFA